MSIFVFVKAKQEVWILTGSADIVWVAVITPTEELVHEVKTRSPVLAGIAGTLVDVYNDVLSETCIMVWLPSVRRSVRPSVSLIMSAQYI